MANNKDNMEDPAGKIFLLDPLDLKGIENYLRSREWLPEDSTVASAEETGDGYMNSILRVTTNRLATVILKQSRPWIAKNKVIEAPLDRVIREARFYFLIEPHVIGNQIPKLLWLDPISRIIALQDLGQVENSSEIYKGKPLSKPDLTDITRWLSYLHQIKFEETSRQSLLNRDMRQLNHEQIFTIPLLPHNGLDLDSTCAGLKREANILKGNKELVEMVDSLGNIYLSDGPTLIHGEFIPANWLRTKAGIWIIDPEFSAFSHPEFDTGTMLAHLILSKHDTEILETFLETYIPPETFSETRMLQFAGVEIIRRTIGNRPTPNIGNNSLAENNKLLKLAKKLILKPNTNDFLA